MKKKYNISLPLLIVTVIFINLFGAFYYYNFVTGQIEQARLLYENSYGNDSDFNSIFWLCQKILTGGH